MKIVENKENFFSKDKKNQQRRHDEVKPFNIISSFLRNLDDFS